MPRLYQSCYRAQYKARCRHTNLCAHDQVGAFRFHLTQRKKHLPRCRKKKQPSKWHSPEIAPSLYVCQRANRKKEKKQVLITIEIRSSATRDSPLYIQPLKAIGYLFFSLSFIFHGDGSMSTDTQVLYTYRERKKKSMCVRGDPFCAFSTGRRVASC